ncbi:MAG TPA: hypothetical protein VGO11_21065 [Chthoniobacteraceae bacterium]|jgi:hypothetical protein|nr:hypothetical protein [Chthoniobacteraceae bacterium]
MAREINLDGAEITIIKAIGVGGGEISGEDLLKKIPSQSSTDLASILKDLIMVGYLDADKNSFYSDEEFKSTHFHVNPGYAKELRDALDPEDPKPKSRRVRRE